MGGKRQKNQMELAFEVEARGEAPRATGEGIEPCVAMNRAENPASELLMEVVLRRENLMKALKRVKANKGSPGVDGMSVKELDAHLKTHWDGLRASMLRGTYEPQPVKRVEIPKAGGGVRKLGIPTVLDRFIQQALMQVLQADWDELFSNHSYGFRPGRSAHQAVAKAQEHMASGCNWVVDLDLEKFFDRVNHDILMGLIAKRVKDRRVLKLIRAFLNAGVMENGLVSATDEGTPQGGPLSPLLSNLLLDELDKELEKRGLRFVRYADDCNIYVHSERAGRRVKTGITNYLAERLKLKVNESKSAVAKPERRKFLGFSFFRDRDGAPRRRIAPQALERFKARARELTACRQSWEVQRRKLISYLIGWRGYYGHTEAGSVLAELDGWLRRRIRCSHWRQWRNSRARFAQLRKRGVSRTLAAQTVGSGKGPWRISASPALNIALSNAYLTTLGLPTLAQR